MEVKDIRTRKCIMELTEEEAQWLNAVMQNPIVDHLMVDESPDNRAMREKFFNATKPFQKALVY